MGAVIVLPNSSQTISQPETDTLVIGAGGTLNVLGTPTVPIDVTLSQIATLGVGSTINLSDATVHFNGVAQIALGANFNIGTNGTLDFHNIVGVSGATTINFGGATGKFLISTVLTPTLSTSFSGFGPGKTIDIASAVVSSVSYADNPGSETGGNLTLYGANNTALEMLPFTSGNFTTANFGLVPDGLGGTIINLVSTVTGIATTPSTATIGPNAVVGFIVSMSNPVSLTGGIPSLTLNDGGTAIYNSAASTSTQLAFTYTVAAGQNTSDLAVTGIALNGSTLSTIGGGLADLSGAIANPIGTLVVDTVSPTVLSAVLNQPNGILGSGGVATFSLTTSEPVITGSGTPVLMLNDGGTATLDAAQSTANTLVFRHVVQPGQNSADLAVIGTSLNNATIGDQAGNLVNLAGAIGNPAGTLVVDGIAPTVSAISTDPGAGTLVAGQMVTVALDMSESVVVNGGTPTLTLSDGGMATYDAAHSTPTRLVFQHTILPGQSTTDLAIVGTSLGGATLTDIAGNSANLLGAIGNPAGLLAIGTAAQTPGTTPSSPDTSAATAPLSVYRFFDTNAGTHFYTTNEGERDMIIRTRPDLVPEGVGLRSINPAANDPNAREVYRFFDKVTGTQFLTSDTDERNNILTNRPDLTFEPAGSFFEHIQPQAGDTAVYRFFNNHDGTHFYTDNPTERAGILLTRPDMVAEGIGFYEPSTT